jgi:hypothetical protein
MCNNEFITNSSSSNICSACRYNKKNEFISKTDAKKIYLMSDEELKNFVNFCVKCKYGYGTYYIIDEIIRYANVHHMEWIDKNNKKEKIKQNRENKKNLRTNEIYDLQQKYNDLHAYTYDIFNTYISNGRIIDLNGNNLENLNKLDIYLNKMKLRKNKLLRKLKRRNLNLRSDSKLCNTYICYGINKVNEILQDEYDEPLKSVREIANIMLEMNFLFSKTSYKQIMDDMINRERRNYLDFEYLDFEEHGMHRYNIHKISQKAKKTAVEKYLKNHSKNDVPLSLLKKTKKIKKS